MSVKHYNPNDVVVLIDGFDVASDIVNESDVISIEYNEDRASIMSALDGSTHATFNSNIVGKITFKFYTLSDAKIKVLTQMNTKATSIVTIKNKAQTLDLAILTGSVVKNVGTKSFGKGGDDSPTMEVVFEGKLRIS